MGLYFVGALIGIVLLVVWLGSLPPSSAKVLIQVRNGSVFVRRGHVDSLARQHVTEILDSAGVTRGYVAITTDGRVAFSRTIPPAVHQRLRNVLLNQSS